MEEKKRCPYCGEEILAIARKCKHCGEWLEIEKLEKEKKACPICGEMIDVDLEICSSCHEPIHVHASDSRVKHPSNTNDKTPENHDLFSNVFLNCKYCRKPLSIDANICPHCGETDPFRFKEVKRIEKNSHIGCWGFIVLCVIVEVLFSVFGVHEGILNWLNNLEWPQLLVLAIISIAASFFFKCILKKNIDKIAKEMADIFTENNNKEAIDHWWSRVWTIVGDWWSNVLWPRN